MSLRRKAVPGPQGLSVQQLAVLAGKIGLRCQSVRVLRTGCGKSNFLRSAHWNGDHYVVLQRVNGKRCCDRLLLGKPNGDLELGLPGRTVHRFTRALQPAFGMSQGYRQVHLGGDREETVARDTGTDNIAAGMRRNAARVGELFTKLGIF